MQQISEGRRQLGDDSNLPRSQQQPSLSSLPQRPQPSPSSFFLLQVAHLILPICQASALATSSSTRTSIAVVAPQWKLGQPLVLRHLSSSDWVFTHKPRLA
ncbi:hypothetical protein ACFX2J_030726 [Malus domestica]